MLDDNHRTDANDEENSPSINRRHLLAGASGAIATGLAGCPIPGTGGGSSSPRSSPTGSSSSGGGGGSASPPVIVDATLPPTAVKVDEQVSFDITIDTSPTNVPADASNAVAQGYVNVLRRGSVTTTALSPTTNVVEVGSDRLRFEYTFDAPNVAVQHSHASRPQGLGYNMSASALFGGGGNAWNIGQFAGGDMILAPHTIQSSSSGASVWFQTWAFDRVDSTAMVPALASNESPGVTGAALFHQLRVKAERVCRYYASELGSMGAIGIDATAVTRTNDHPTGWISLPRQQSTYRNQTNSWGMPEQFAEDALDLAADRLGVTFSSWDTAAVLSDATYGNAFYSGDFVSTPVRQDFGMIDVEIQTSALQNMLPVSAYDTPTGRTDYWMDRKDGDAWLHEIGHSLGPGNKVGLPDLYDKDYSNLGVIHDWGQMSTGDVMQSWCRQLGGYFFDSKSWLTKADHLHLLTDTPLELRPLTDKELGDQVANLTTMWGEFNVALQASTQSVTVTPRNVHLRTYVLEARRNGSTRLNDPQGNTTLERSPASANGIAIYRFGKFDLQGSVNWQDVLTGNNPIQISNLTAVDYQYVNPTSGSESEPTISRSLSNQYRTRTVSDAAMTFEQQGQVSAGSATAVRVSRDPQSLIGQGVHAVATVTSNVKSYVEQQLSSGLPAPEPVVDIPGADILAETDDGRRAGIDPDTGEVYEEIDGAVVEESGLRQTVRLPGDAPVTVSVSTTRLRDALGSLGVEVPDRIPTSTELTLTADPQIDDRRSLSTEALPEPIPFLEGRTRQTHELPLPPGATETVVTPAIEMDVLPGENPADTEDLVFVDLFFDRPIDPELLAFDTVALGSTQPVHPEERDAVPFYIVEEGPQATLRFAFDRATLRTRFGEGEHVVFVSGIFDNTAFYAPAELELS